MVAIRYFSLLLVMVSLSSLPSSSLPSQAHTTLTSTTLFLTTQFSTFVVGTTTFSELTRASYNGATGTIPASYISDSGLQVCYYVPFQFHVDGSVRRIVGNVSVSSPVNFYLMSQAQYDEFVSKNPPCGSSFHALALDYSRSSFAVNMALDPGDYFILTENTSMSTVTYSVELSAIGNVTSSVYSTEQRVERMSSTIQYVSDHNTSSSSIVNTSSQVSTTLPLAIAVIFIAALISYAKRRRERVRRQGGTRVY